MFLPGQARLIHFYLSLTIKNLSLRFTTKCDTNHTAQLYRRRDSINFTYRNYNYCYIHVVNTNGADQTARILQAGKHLKVCCSQIAKTGFLVKCLSESITLYSKNSQGLK